MRKKITLRAAVVRGKKMWRVRWHEALNGTEVVRRSFFAGADKAGAKKFASLKRGEFLRADDRFFLLSAEVKERLLMAWQLAQERGIDLLSLVSNARGSAIPPTASGVLQELLEVKKKAGKNKDYIRSLRLVVGAFIAGRESLPVNLFVVTDLEAFLDGKKLASRPTLRSRLAAFFKFAVRRLYRPDNPCDALERVVGLKKRTVIFSPEQAAACIQFLIKPAFHANMPRRLLPKRGHAHRGLAWFLLTAFAGLRPEEAAALDRKFLFLNAKKPHIEVPPEICKTGQWRFVYPLPGVVQALKWAMDHGSAMPLGLKSKRRLQVALRAVLGLPRWPHDVTRHSAASYWLAMVNDQRHVAEMLGHTEAVQRKHYKKPVERATAVAFYNALSEIK